MLNLTSLSLSPEHDEVVNGYGKIVRSIDFWRLSWSEKAEGYIEVNRYATFTNPEDALPLIQDILGGDTL